MIESEGSSAIGRTDSWPWSGSLIRPEMNDDAADDGFYQYQYKGGEDVQLQTLWLQLVT
jgi:hypothetical protein